ncbi:hypothetical protein GCM10009634_78370 [Saccharothrix xinjiangensis]
MTRWRTGPVSTGWSRRRTSSGPSTRARTEEPGESDMKFPVPSSQTRLPQHSSKDIGTSLPIDVNIASSHVGGFE